ncbi:sensor histidine kinase [Nocardiopsis mangrovi]|uniref:histidine kinase n=1 Tax=Nocardiopsis mangrovi TaxID=1179818 RepID=A0ABV9DRQ5_9ACTN
MRLTGVRALLPGPRGLRGRLVLTVLCLTAVCLTAFGVTGVALLERSLVADIDDRLGELAHISTTLPAPPDPPGGPPISPPPLPTDLRALSIGSDGEVAWSVGQTTDDADRPDISGLGATELADRAGTPFTLPGTDGGSGWRVLTMRSGDGSVRMVADSLAETDRTLNRLIAIESVIGAVLLVVLGAGAVTIVRLQLRPLARIEGTAQAIAAGRLDERVPYDDPGTETGRLGRALNTMLGTLADSLSERARTADRMRRFVADASHELRTPLSSIRGFAELYRQSRDQGRVRGGPEIDHWMRRIESEADRMGGLVDDLLVLARFDERPPLEPDDVDLAALARDAVGDARARAPGEPISLDAPEPVRVVGDERRLRQVLANLIGNALAHTPEGTAVRVEVAYAPAPLPDGAQAGAGGVGALPAGVTATAVVRVRDEGPGIAPGDAPHVFDRFYRPGGDRSRDRGGAGLGLAIVAAIVTAHEGRVELGGTGTQDRGTTFTVVLPLG